ncbi:hypothetical protein Vadar_032990 [Vaccinium darrowii]|uniref:Uncharacterized protein n=1 Tax=Vaccinium darrowii TaxID=229202 RepID=A0ACB7X5U5_9ERIC|nr:hypothetical protein Vadar_032990 [Vaccinium darrowii]
MAIKTQDTTTTVQSFLSLALHAIRLPSKRLIFFSSPGIIWVDLLHMVGSNHPKSLHSFLGQEMNLHPGFAAIQEPGGLDDTFSTAGVAEAILRAS